MALKTRNQLFVGCLAVGCLLSFAVPAQAEPRFGLSNIVKKTVDTASQKAKQEVKGNSSKPATAHKNQAPIFARLSPGIESSKVTGNEMTYEYLQIRPNETDFRNPLSYEWVKGTTPRRLYGDDGWSKAWVAYPGKANNCVYKPFYETSESQKHYEESKRKQALIEGRLNDEEDVQKEPVVVARKTNKLVLQEDLIKTKVPKDIYYRYEYETYPRFISDTGNHPATGRSEFTYENIANYYLEQPNWQDSLAPFLSFLGYYNTYLNIELDSLIDKNGTLNHYAYNLEDDQYKYNTYVLYYSYNDSIFFKNRANKKTPFRRGVAFVDGEYKNINLQTFPTQKSLWVEDMKAINEKDAYSAKSMYYINDLNSNELRCTQSVFTDNDDTLAKGMACFSDLQKSYTEQYNNYIAGHATAGEDYYGVKDALEVVKYTFELFRLVPTQQNLLKLVDAHKTYNKLHTEPLVEIAKLYWQQALNLKLDERYAAMSNAIDYVRYSILLLPTEENIKLYDEYINVYNTELNGIIQKRLELFKASPTHKTPGKSAISKVNSKAKKEAKEYGKKSWYECSDEPNYEVKGSQYSIDPADVKLHWYLSCKICYEDGKRTRFDVVGDSVIAETYDAASCFHVSYEM